MIKKQLTLRHRWLTAEVVTCGTKIARPWWMVNGLRLYFFYMDHKHSYTDGLASGTVLGWMSSSRTLFQCLWRSKGSKLKPSIYDQTTPIQFEGILDFTLPHSNCRLLILSQFYMDYPGYPEYFDTFTFFRPVYKDLWLMAWGQTG